jgi:hypothetical protein
MVTMKGRHTIRAHTPGGREPRLVEPNQQPKVRQDMQPSPAL